MKINITKPFGNFNVAASCEVDEKTAQELVTLGALYLFERAPSTAVEQKVFGPMLGWELTESGKSYKRPRGFERNSVAYTAGLAEKVKAAYDATPGKLGSGDGATLVKFTVESITENVSNESSPMVRASAFVDGLLGDEAKEAQLRGLFATLGMEDAEDASREQLVEFAHSKGMGVQPPKKK